MNALAKARFPARPRSDSSRQIALFYAGVLVIFAVTQLFTFEAFRELVILFNLPLSEVTVAVLVPVLVAAEVFALPFLLGMALSPAFRWVSMVAGWFVPLVWFLISVCVAQAYPVHDNIGFLGTTFALVPGWWAVLFSVLMGVMAAWASWGRWPARKAKNG